MHLSEESPGVVKAQGMKQISRTLLELLPFLWPTSRPGGESMENSRFETATNALVSSRSKLSWLTLSRAKSKGKPNKERQEPDTKPDTKTTFR